MTIRHPTEVASEEAFEAVVEGMDDRGGMIVIVTVSTEIGVLR